MKVVLVCDVCGQEIDGNMTYSSTIGPCVRVQPCSFCASQSAERQPQSGRSKGQGTHNSTQPAIARIKNMLANWKHFDMRQVELTLRDIVATAGRA